MQNDQKRAQAHFLNQQREGNDDTKKVEENMKGCESIKKDEPKADNVNDQPKQQQQQQQQQQKQQKQQQQQQQQPKEQAKGGNDQPKGGKGKGGGGGGKPKPKPGSDEDLFQKFSQLEIRIGNLDQVWKHPDSEKLWCEKINIGTEIREIASGLQKIIPLDAMIGKVIIAANLKPKSLGGFPSAGMVMCASLKTAEGEKEVIEMIRPDDSSVVGERVYLDGIELEDTK